MKLSWIFGMVLFTSMPIVVADENQTQQISNDCYQEWQSRGWVVGAEGTIAADLPRFQAGIEQFCEVRTELYLTDSSYSPYIQETLRELAPFIFTATKQQIRDHIIHVHASGERFSGNPYLSE